MFSNTKTQIDAAKINELLARAFGNDVKVIEITELTEGMFNAIYLLRLEKPVYNADEIVLKLGVQPYKHILHYEKEIMRTELYVYSLLPGIGVPAPKILYADTTQTLLDCDYFFMDKLSGDTWANYLPLLSAENKAALEEKLGEYTAKLHTVQGDYYGYIKQDPAYHYPTWREVFRSFIDRMVEDGIRDNVKLPYDELYTALDPYWTVLDGVTAPSLVNYDMWTKNIMLKKVGDAYEIDAIIDHERAFFGDPVADFPSLAMICGKIEDCLPFQQGYRKIRPFIFGESERRRLQLYHIYMALMLGVEIYRYDIRDREACMRNNSDQLLRLLSGLREA